MFLGVVSHILSVAGLTKYLRETFIFYACTCNSHKKAACHYEWAMSGESVKLTGYLGVLRVDLSERGENNSRVVTLIW